jgi:adenosine deaminase
MALPEFIARLPKVELHVHLEGSIRPETVLKLAQRHGIELPAEDVDGLREWYRFRDFPHFVEVYVQVSRCVRTPQDIELVAWEFLEGQAAQNILHTEATYTASTIERFNGIPWPDQIDALDRARLRAEQELGITCGWIIDIVRGEPAERGLEVAQWAVKAQDRGVVALGLAGEERRGHPRDYREAFDLAHVYGLPVVPHAGETEGAWSVKACLEACRPARIGHGVRCLEDPELVAQLRELPVPLEVCPSSNVRLGVAPSLEEHPLPKLIEAGLWVTLNSDDPPMFGTTLTEEYIKCAETFGWDEEYVRAMALRATEAALVNDRRREELRRAVREFSLPSAAR